MTTMTNDKNTDPTKTRIAEMLRENTGSHFLDSGGTTDANGRTTGGYGRHHERNASVTDEMWERSKSAVVNFRYGIDVTINAYHFLTTHLSFSEDDTVRKLFSFYCDSRGEYAELSAVDGFIDWLRENGIEASGIYGEGEPVCVNTYNGEDLLSQTIQYTYACLQGTIGWGALASLARESDPTESDSRILYKELTESEGDDDGIYVNDTYVFLQVHGGCDVRGGYTDVEVFTESGMSELGILDNARGYIGCSNPDCDCNWSTDDGCHWYADGCCGHGAEPQLETYETRVLPDTCDERSTIDSTDMLAADLGLDSIDTSAIGEKAFRLACEHGQTGAIRYLESALESGEMDDETEAEHTLMLGYLCGDISRGRSDDERFLYTTETGVGFCPSCGHKLEASF